MGPLLRIDPDFSKVLPEGDLGRSHTPKGPCALDGRVEAKVAYAVTPGHLWKQSRVSLLIKDAPTPGNFQWGAKVTAFLAAKTSTTQRIQWGTRAS